MVTPQQSQDGAHTLYVRAASPAPASWERPGWEDERLVADDYRRPPLVTTPVDEPAPPTSSRRRLTGGFWSRALGFTGLVLGAAGAAVLAHQMGYDWRLTGTIAALVGVAGGAAGVTIPLLLRAIGWLILAALVGLVGAASLYALMHVAPVFVERFVR